MVGAADQLRFQALTGDYRYHILYLPPHREHCECHCHERCACKSFSLSDATVADPAAPDGPVPRDDSVRFSFTPVVA
jgi:hypothetical protein